MFTGIIKKTCLVKSLRKTAGGISLYIDLAELAGQSNEGDSISVNGTCLTVTEISNRIARLDVSGETLQKTTLASLKPSSEVNIELSLKGTDRFGGHFVQGHIDGVGQIRKLETKGEFWDITFSADEQLVSEMILKGSVAVDGISLTVADMDERTFRAAVIPETIKRTTLGKAKEGDRVNIETDIIVKTIKKQLQNIMPPKEHLTVEKLKEMGY